MCDQGTLCFELIKGLPAAFVTLVIGGIAAYVAWRQHQTAREKLKLDLFDKRYEVFEHTCRLLSEAQGNDEEINLPFAYHSELIPKARFLFGEAIEEYLQEIGQQRIELWILNERIMKEGRLPKNEEQQHLDLLAWFLRESTGGARDAFLPYLDFTHVI
ncbi:MAG: hypothetical protein WAV95_17845 [Azonexus sp.]